MNARTQPPGPGEGKRGEDGHLGYLLRQANVAFRTRIERALADLGVTHPQFAVLTMLGAYPGLSNAELSRLSYLTPQTVNVIVANLARAGLLQKTPHAVHGRVLNLGLTKAGAAILKRCKARVSAIEYELEAGLSAAQQRAIRRWLVKVALDSSAASRPPAARSRQVGSKVGSRN